MRRGFLLGKFMPPHAGHISLIEAALKLVDELTILVCSLPDDPIAGQTRLDWMRTMFPFCRVVWHGEPAPQTPEESPSFWPTWRRIVAQAHPEPIDYLFAGEDYGARLAHEVGGLFVPLGARVLGADQGGLGGLSSSGVRADPWGYWQFLPKPVRDYYAITVCVHGVESTGKSMLAEQLAAHYSTVLVPEYGRTHCGLYSVNCEEKDLLLIGNAQQAMIEAARPWCNKLLIVDTDSLMTTAWSKMMIGYAPDELVCHRRAELYLMLGCDAPFIDDGTRIYGDVNDRVRFDCLAREVLTAAGVTQVDISGTWEERFHRACAAIDALVAGLAEWRRKAAA